MALLESYIEAFTASPRVGVAEKVSGVQGHWIIFDEAGEWPEELKENIRDQIRAGVAGAKPELLLLLL